MMKKENPRSRMRCDMSKMFTENGVSLHTQAEMTECMYGKTDEEKEKLAEKLMEIISTSTTEEEMIAKSMELRDSDTKNEIKSYYGKNVTVVLEEGEIFSGVVVEYFFPEDNELGEESIILKTKKFGLIEFTASEIHKINHSY